MGGALSHAHRLPVAAAHQLHSAAHWLLGAAHHLFGALNPAPMQENHHIAQKDKMLTYGSSPNITFCTDSLAM